MYNVSVYTLDLIPVHTQYMCTVPSSVDGNVYVWRNGKEKPALVLRGHSRTVNCVAWDPVHHATLASASDDGRCSPCVAMSLMMCPVAGTVRVWGKEKLARRHRSQQSSAEQVTDASDINRVSSWTPIIIGSSMLVFVTEC